MDIGSYRTVKEFPFDEATLKVLGVTDYTNRVYVSPALGDLGLYIGYFRTQRTGATIHSPKNCLPGAGWQPTVSEIYQLSLPDGRKVPVNLYVIRKDLDQQIVLYWYQSRQSLIASEYSAKVRLLGTSLWDDPSLGNEPALVGGWYAAPPADSWAAFAQRYRAAYNLAPPRIASLSYDATTLALALAKQGANFSPAALTQPSGFSGVDGIFRFTDSGLVERGLAVYELHKGGATQIDPAPKSFEALTQ